MGCGASSPPPKVPDSFTQSQQAEDQQTNAAGPTGRTAGLGTSPVRQGGLETPVVKPVERISMLNANLDDEKKDTFAAVDLDDSSKGLKTNPDPGENQETTGNVMDSANDQRDLSTNPTDQKIQMTPTVERENVTRFNISDVHFDKVIGEGSFGTVYLSRNKESGTHYALKRLEMGHVIRLKQVDHVNNERRIWASLRHPFICRLFGTSRDDRYLYLLLELAQGGEMFSMLRRERKFCDETAKFYAAEIALALDYLHRNDIVYRGLKPEDILISKGGHVKLTDFGYAKVVLHRTYTICGSPEYMAPELLLNKGHGKPVDWWTFGVLVYEMLVGQPPFCDEDPMLIYQKILAGKVYFPKFISSDAKNLIKGLLCADVKKRMSSSDIFPHPWFKNLDWESLMAQTIPPPHVPRIAHDGDVSCFDTYPESSPDSSISTVQQSDVEACFVDF
ncbi:PRKX [Branchiostoma lanceolatum]|uniref:non-specific serine/threonine protein kinase n=1 Tax=Branchiostoma lanceolatum TaxID=7740 RepID=A0A8K0ENR4_BRALA|nr:PRKX [Branchiostoma lanceolatum]